jgi:hypothetical protein
VTVGVLELLTMTVMLLIGYHMVLGPTCGGAGDCGSIGVADNDCDVAGGERGGGRLNTNRLAQEVAQT